MSESPTVSSEANFSLHSACRLGDLKLISQILQTQPASVNERDSKLNWSPLFRTVVSGHTKAAKLLLSKGANPNLTNDLGQTPLHQAAESSKYSMAKLLLTHQANPNSQQTDGLTPLHISVDKFDIPMIQLLLKHRADPNIANFSNKQTPFHWSVAIHQEEITRLLLLHGANPLLEDLQGKNALQIAQDPSFKELLQDQHYIDSQESWLDESSENINIFGSQKISSLDIQHGKLYYWLQSLNLEQYFDKLVDSGYDNLDEMVQQMKTPIPLSTSELESVGISKCGHRYKILIRLDADAGIWTPMHIPKLFYNRNWCYSCSKNLQLSEVTLQGWLKFGGLEGVLDELLQGGYDMELVLFQAQSPYRFTNSILKNELKIMDMEVRRKLLNFLSDSVNIETGQPMHIRESPCNKCVLM